MPVPAHLRKAGAFLQDARGCVWIMGAMTLRLVVPITPCLEPQLCCWSTLVMCGMAGIMAVLSKLYGVRW